VKGWVVGFLGEAVVAEVVKGMVVQDWVVVEVRVAVEVEVAVVVAGPQEVVVWGMVVRGLVEVLQVVEQVGVEEAEVVVAMEMAGECWAVMKAQVASLVVVMEEVGLEGLMEVEQEGEMVVEMVEV
jgi:hypothetical protein